MGEKFGEFFNAVPEFSQEDKEQEMQGLKNTYEGSDLVSMIKEQEKLENVGAALFTDIDNTFTKKGGENATKELQKKSREKSLPIIAVTGNDFEGMAKRIQSGELPYFEAIAGAVGTEIWIKHTDENGGISYKKDVYFENMLLQTGYGRKELCKKALLMISDFEKNHPEWKLGFQRPDREKKLLEKPDTEHQKFKISFHFFSDPSEIEKISREVSLFFPDQSIVLCEEINYNKTLKPDESPKKYCLDILPITKAGSVQYLAKIIGVKKGIVAGDSGNDTGMLLESGSFSSVLVGGYAREAKNTIEKNIEIKKKGKRSFQKIKDSKNNPKAIYIEQNPKREAAESILRAAEILQRAENIKKIREKKIHPDQ